MRQTGRFVHRDMVTGTLIAVAMIQISAWLPLMGFMIAMLLPAPIVFYRLKCDPITALVIAAFGCLASPLINGHVGPDQLVHASLLVFGLIMGEGWARNEPRERFVLRGILSVMAGTTLVLVIRGMASGIGLLPMLEGYVRANLELSLKIYNQMGIPAQTVSMFEQSLPLITSAMVRLLPAVSASVLILSAWLSILTVLQQTRRLEIPAPKIGALIHWRVPNHWVWAVIACGGSLLLPLPGLRLAAIGGLLVLLTLYFMQGMAILGFWLDHRNAPRWVRTVIYTLIVFQQFLLVALMVTGLFDTWFDFRKRIETKPKA